MSVAAPKGADPKATSTPTKDFRVAGGSSDLDETNDDDEIPPPAYGDQWGIIENVEDGFGTRATLTDNGRIDIRIKQKTTGLSTLLAPALRNQLDLAGRGSPPPPYVPPSLAAQSDGVAPPSMHVVIHVVGSRGDVQPFVALGKVLKEKYGHRVRLATHPVFKDFVTENGLEFFNIGGDPSELMAFMVKNPGLMPDFSALRSGDVGKRRKDIGNMIWRCWRSCIEPGDGTEPETSYDNVQDYAKSNDVREVDGTDRSFVADAIIANPPSFAHIHCAEKLGIPLHMMFTMPWSPTQAFPHPLANITSTNAGNDLTNMISYALVEMMTWQGLCDIINRFRQKYLNLDPINLLWAPGMLARLRVPWTYCWSPALIPKPRDWGPHISISGFYFLPLGTNFTPEPDLAAFLSSGPPPIYIGFGSIVVDDPNALTKLIFDAVKTTGQRALVSKGWGGIGADQIGIPKNVFMLGNVPHDWLFQHVSCVVHHGGAGTTAAGIACGKPTVVVPFFGDQTFWGEMVARAGAGPEPVSSKELNAELLAAAITQALKPSAAVQAEALAQKIKNEQGAKAGALDFHHRLDVNKLRCLLCPDRVAVWHIKRSNIRLSAFAITVLLTEKLINLGELKQYRACEYDIEVEPWDPITGGASALVGTLSSMSMDIADLPVAALMGLQIHPDASKKPAEQGGTSRVASTEVERSESTIKGPHLNVSDGGAVSVSEGAQEDQLEDDGVENKTPTASTSTPTQTTASAPHKMPSSASARSEAPATIKFDFESAVETGKGAMQFVSAGIKSPMDFTLGLARGFHNAPKLYGDRTVRKSEKITDFSSGLRAAGKELQYGFYDGITGLLTQPMEGVKQEGVAGFFKGFAKGIGGIALKPAAAFWGVPAYTSRGIYKELQKALGPSVDSYILASRTAQGYEDLQKSTLQQRQDVISLWKEVQLQTKGLKNLEEDQLQAIMLKLHAKDNGSSETTPASTTTPTLQGGTLDAGEASNSEIEEAIRKSVAETSRGDAAEDALIQRAIRISMAELHSETNREADDEELQRAVQASVKEARSGSRPVSKRENLDDAAGVVAEEATGRDKGLEEVLEESKQTHITAAAEEEEAKREEEIVMKFVLKQSLIEEEARKGKETAP